MILVSKESIYETMNAYGESYLAEKVLILSDENIIEIGKIASKFIGQYALVDKCIAHGAIVYFEGVDRELAKKKRNLKHYKTKIAKDEESFFKKYLKLIFKK